MRDSYIAPIGDHPQMNPVPDPGPCPNCKGKAAARLASEALEAITGSDDFPVHHTREFLDKFGVNFYTMAEFLYDAGYAEAKMQDNAECPDHRPTKDDEE